MPAGGSNYLTHKMAPTGTLYQYNTDLLKEMGDRRVSYKSTKFPWLEAAYTYKNVMSHASDFDAVRVSVPGFAGRGHYVAHWWWQGYSECVDIDYFPDNKITHVDGQVCVCCVFVRARACVSNPPKNLNHHLINNQNPNTKWIRLQTPHLRYYTTTTSPRVILYKRSRVVL